MSKKKFSFVDLADDNFIEENIIKKEEEVISVSFKEKEIIKKNEPKIDIIVPTKSIKIENKKLFFTEKEKLDVKTNIYLKKNNYLRIEQLYKNTGNSRSSIINKLIELAFKNIDEN